MNQTTDTLLLVRPFLFRKNEETAVNNYFQEDLLTENAASSAQREFDHFVRVLTDNKINTFVVQDTGLLDTPDSIFPNNCISFHKRTAVLYPMFAENRRRERQLNVLDALAGWGLTFDDIVDYTHFESENRFLEGTGCLILDRINRIAYCSLSPRADAGIAHQFCLDLGYDPFIFEANQTVDGLRKAIYHTNVMMCLGTRFATVCLDSIDNTYYKAQLQERLEGTGKSIVAISEEQMQNFCGNMLEVKSIVGEPYIIMSSRAYNSLSFDQIEKLSSFGQIIHAPLDTIETGGGGSARCMIAEVFY
ncbi:citrulline utilization hydrolase CtlX [Sphingobacterium suaedae]|uniref:Citrulline utilization hydrolase CtlX n=1 Tax=Sphingobacterium suaedae TaxID=1686402 RepID=A0ABW5KFI2_9SPHI